MKTIIPVMWLEHLIYSLAIAIIAGMIHFRYTGRDYSWIIIASAYAPDIDIIPKVLFHNTSIPLMSGNVILKHGNFHNIVFLVLYAFLIALILFLFKYKFIDSLIFAGIGFGAHIFEDALVSNPTYPFFWPISNIATGIGIFNYSRDFYGIANQKVLVFGLILVALCTIVRIVYNINKWKKIWKNHRESFETLDKIID